MSSPNPSGVPFAITKSDSTVLNPPTRGIYVGGAGDLAVRGKGNQASVTFVGVPAGTLLPIIADKVLSTGTTATSIVGLA